MNGYKESILATKQGFEASFKEKDFYNKQTQDQEHLNHIIDFLQLKSGIRILDLGCGSGYLTFELAKNKDIEVVGLDIVENTLIANRQKAAQEGYDNLTFICYDGNQFPFENGSFDLVVSRYALHHFPAIEMSIKEVAKVLKKNGRFFLSDPRPNECDQDRFVDEYMKQKKDGHIQFVTKEEWIRIGNQCGLSYLNSFDSIITFPKRKDTAPNLESILAKYPKEIIDSYSLRITDKEIWISEEVNNMIFQKEG